MTGILLALSFLLGLLLHDSDGGWILAAPVALAALLLVASSRTPSQRAVVLLCLVCVGFGALRAESTGHAGDDHLIVAFNEADGSIIATIAGPPRPSANRTHVRLRFDGSNSSIASSLPLLPDVADGDVVRFFAPDNWASPAPGYVAIPLDGRAEVFIPSFDVVGANVSMAGDERTRLTRYVTGAIQAHVPEPAGSLTLGIMTGDDTGMTSATRAAFRSAGLSHVTAVSGWNVALFAGLILVPLRRLAPTRWPPTLMGMGAIWCYAFLVGMQPSVVRAAGMATVFLIAHLRGRSGDLLTSLLLTISVMIAVTPDIRFDVGFQLSVAATLGVVLLLELGDERSLARETLAMPFVAELAIAPLLLHHFGSYSLLAIPTNVVAAPLVVLVMWFGIGTVLFAFWFPVLADLCGTLAWVPARLVIAIAERTAAIHWASSTTITLRWSTMLIVYGLMLGAYLWWIHWRCRMQRADLAVRPENLI